MTTVGSTLASGAFSAANEAEANKPSASIASQEVFLQLLVAQLQNQNPLNPMDGMEFVAQLAQFSQLEQLTSIRNGIESLVGLALSQKSAASGGVDSQTSL